MSVKNREIEKKKSKGVKIMKKEAIEEYILKKYRGIVAIWHAETTAELRTKDLETMLLLEEVLGLFGYTVKNGCHDTELFKGRKSVFKYTF